MPRPRLPSAKAKTAGRDVINPGRFKNRKEPKARPLGNPPKWMNEAQCESWHVIAYEIPWLNSSHRVLLSIAVVIHARMSAGQDVGVPALNTLRLCMSQMGASPVDASKVTVPDEGEEDPAEAFFKRPN